MNFKDLKKIPVPPAPQTDIPAEAIVHVPKEHYRNAYGKEVKNYLYLAEIAADMLIVTVYHGGEFVWRTFIADNNYCTQKADNPKKSTASVRHLTSYNEIYNPINGVDETVRQYADTVYKYSKLPRLNFYLEKGMAVVNALQEHIRSLKTAERHRKIREATEECMLEIRPPVKGFNEWLKRQSSSIYIIYHTGDGYGVCTHCLKKVEQGKAKWKHKEDLVCPHCKKRAKLLCSGRYKDGRIEVHRELFWYTQKTRSGCCVRLFEASYSICKNTTYGYDKEQVIPITREWNKSSNYYERARVFLDRNGCIDQSFEWGNFMQTGENYWVRNRDVYYTAHFYYYTAHFYTANLKQALSNYEQLKYIPWKGVSQITDNKGYFWDIIKTLIRCPWIEYLLKIKMNSLAHDFLRGYYDERKVSEFVDGKPNPAKRTSLAHILGLNRRELREIIPYDPDMNELKLYKVMLRNRAGVEEWKQLRDFANYNTAIASALEYQPVSRYMRYIAEQAEQYQDQEHGDMTDVIRDYADYIQEAKAANYNLRDTATINPKSLIAAHADSEINSRLEGYKRNYSKYAGEFALAAERIAKVKGIIYEDEQYRIAPIMSWEEIFFESKYLRHCVASYTKREVDGYCVIFGIRKADDPDTPMYTLELSGDFQNIRQCRGFKNRSVPEKVMEVVNKWHEKLVAKNDRKAG